MARPTIAYVIEPRFPGGTSSAVAQELQYAARAGRLIVHAISTRMFDDAEVAPALQTALDRLGLTLHWDAPSIRADVVVVHNPSALRFDTSLATRIVCRRLIVVAHENFLRPGGGESFDVGKTLEMLDRASTAIEKMIAPVSPYNRETINAWCERTSTGRRWTVTDYDWINICDFDWAAPTASPRDLRGRHSRAGLEKFPADDALDLMFPPSAEANVILGGDILRDAARTRPHWTVFDFGALPVTEFLRQIDFFVYFSAPTWRESFGRVLAEATAAGKVVLTDEETGRVLGSGAVTASPETVGERIAELVANPSDYALAVRSAQEHLRRNNSPEVFAGVLQQALAGSYQA